MNRNRPVTLLPVAVAAIAALLGACSSADTDDSTAAAKPSPTVTASPSPSPSPSSDEPIDLTGVPDSTLEAGKYLVHLLHDEGAIRAVVDVPAGYIGSDSVIGSDSGDAAFWGKVTRVATDACLGGSRPVGPSVKDLATALADEGHMTATRPVPVTVGGYRGLYVRLTAPANLDRCRGKSVLVYTAGGGSTWLQNDVPRGIFRMWILDVDGQRVVAGTRTFAGTPDTDGLNHLIEAAEFTSVDES